MNTYLSADYILPVISEAVQQGVLAIDENKTITGIYKPDAPELEGKKIIKHSGIITPGFVNAHCHLELSHLEGTIPKNTGLVPFLQHVMSLRGTDGGAIEKAMEIADNQLYENGIVAVGDHANSDISKSIKQKSKMYYHTFVEALGFEPEVAAQKFQEALNVVDSFESGASSVTPHAPYSVSKELFKLIRKNANEHEMPLSIHNQESDEENKFFRYKKGQFVDFYDILGKDIKDFKAQARDSLQTFIPYLSVNTRAMLVHNTYTSAKDIYFVGRMGRNITWCFCPNANLYIEGALPKIGNFVNKGYNIVLGTDSLASNERLCILSELKTLHQHFPMLPLTETIKWATCNGAEFLGIGSRFGSLEVGKRPGLNLLKNVKGLALTPETEVERLV